MSGCAIGSESVGFVCGGKSRVCTSVCFAFVLASSAWAIYFELGGLWRASNKCRVYIADLSLVCLTVVSPHLKKWTSTVLLTQSQCEPTPENSRDMVCNSARALASSTLP